MKPGVEAGIDRDAKSRLEGFVGRNDVSVGECLDSRPPISVGGRFHGNDGRLKPIETRCEI